MHNLSNFCRFQFGKRRFAACLAILLFASQTTLHSQETTVVNGVVSETLLDGDFLLSMDTDGIFLDHPGSAWLEFVGGNGPGTTSFSSIGGSSPFYMDNGVLNIEGQALVTFDGAAGGSIGLNRRFYAGPAIVGTGLWYDVTQSPHSHVYNQVGYSLELFIGTEWTIRHNGNFPFGTRSNHLVTTEEFLVGDDVEFQGNNLVQNVFDRVVTERAMKSFDVELATSIGNLSTEAYAGFYHLQAESGPKANGVKGGIRGYVTPRIAGDVTITNDANFGTRVFGGLTWFFGGMGGNSPSTLSDLLTIPVKRGRQVVIGEFIANVANDEPMILTIDDEEITITHVDINADGTNEGTFENPFQMLPTTQDTDIVYVYADGVYTDQSYILSDGQMLLGESEDVEHLIATDQLGNIVLPFGNEGEDKPIIIAPDGQYALTTADDTLISNIDIDNSTQMNGSGIFAGSEDVEIDGVQIDGGQYGINIDNGLGVYTLNDVTLSELAAAALRINGGDAEVTVSGDSSITQTNAGYPILVEGGHSGSLQFNGEIEATDGEGFYFDDADGQYLFNELVTLDNTNAGVEILGDSDGRVIFAEAIITDPTAPGLFIDGGSSQVSFNAASRITKDNAGALIEIIDHDGRVNFDSSSDISQTGIGDGLQFSNADGTYTFMGRVALEDTDAGIVLLNDSDGSFTFDDATVENPVGTALLVDGGSSDITFDGSSSITNDNAGSTISVFNGHSGSISFTSGTSISATGMSAGDGLQFDEADGTYNFNGNILLDGGDAGIDILGASAGTFVFSDTTIVDPTGTAINIEGGSAGSHVWVIKQRHERQRRYCHQCGRTVTMVR